MSKAISLTAHRAGFRLLVALLTVLAVTGALWAAAVSADFALADWRYLKPVTLPEGLAGGELVELTLDREVFHDSAPGQRDLRLIRNGEEEVAYQLALSREREERQPVPVKVRDLGYQPGEYSSFVADVGEGGRLHNEVEISTGGKNFRRETVIETSEDARTWLVVQEGAEIFDFTVAEQDFTARNTRVSYPQSAARYLRVRVINGQEEPLAITGAKVNLTEYEPAVETAYRPSVTNRVEEADTQSTILTLDLGSRGIPIYRLSWQTPAVNFHRSMVIEGSDDLENWQWLGQEAVYSYDTPKFVGQRLQVSFPESFYRYYRATVRNEDNPPLPLEGIELFGVERKVIFEVRPDGDYALYYGNPEASRPSYDLERVLPYLETAGLPLATLGGHRANPAFAPPKPPELPLTERYPWLAPVSVSVAAVAIGALLLGVIRRARKLLRPPGEGSAS